MTIAIIFHLIFLLLFISIMKTFLLLFISIMKTITVSPGNVPGY